MKTPTKQVGGLLKPIPKAQTNQLNVLAAARKPEPIKTFIPTPDPKKLGAHTDVRNMLQTAQTRKGMYGYLQEAGMFANEPDMTPQKWNSLPPEETLKYLGDRSKFGYAYGKTANPGGIQYLTKDYVPAGNRVTKRAVYNEVTPTTSMRRKGGLLPAKK